MTFITVIKGYSFPEGTVDIQLEGGIFSGEFNGNLIGNVESAYRVDSAIVCATDRIITDNIYPKTGGNVNVNTDLNVIGNVYANGVPLGSGNVNAIVDLVINGNLDMDCANITNVESIFVNNVLSKDGGNVDLLGDLNITGNLYVNGLPVLSSNVQSIADLVINGNLDLDCANITNVENIFVNNVLSKDGGNVDLLGDLNITGNLYVNGLPLLSSNVQSVADLVINGNLDMDCANITNVDEFYVSDIYPKTPSANVNVNTDLNVIGNVYANGILLGTGNVNGTGDLLINGNLDMDCANITNVENLFVDNVFSKSHPSPINFHDDINFATANVITFSVSGIAIGNTSTSVSGGSNAIAIGKGATALSADSLALGLNANVAVGIESVAIGKNSETSGSRAISIGVNSFASTTDTISIGTSSKCTIDNSIAIGCLAESSNASCIAIGENTEASGFVSTAIGLNTTARSIRDIVIGTNSITTASTGGYNLIIGDQSSTGAGVDNAVIIGRGGSITANSRAFAIGVNDLSVDTIGPTPYLRCLVNGTPREIPLAVTPSTWVGTATTNLDMSCYNISNVMAIAVDTITAKENGDLVTINDHLLVQGNATINGNLYVLGNVVSVETSVLQVEDNKITLNFGELGAGITLGNAGIIIDRGSLVDYSICYDEAKSCTVIGEVGSEQCVATREDAPVPSGVAYWNDTAKRFDTSSLTIDEITNAIGNLTSYCVSGTRVGTGNVTLSTSPTIPTDEVWGMRIDVVGREVSSANIFYESLIVLAHNDAGNVNTTLLSTVSSYGTGSLSSDDVTVQGNLNALEVVVTTGSAGTTNWTGKLHITSVI